MKDSTLFTCVAMRAALSLGLVLGLYANAGGASAPTATSTEAGRADNKKALPRERSSVGTAGDYWILAFLTRLSRYCAS
jgi:hypothetical protein